MLQEAGGAGMPLQQQTACHPRGRRIHPATIAGMKATETKKAGTKPTLVLFFSQFDFTVVK